MKFKQHYSGSSGNFYEIIANNGKRLLIDPGVSWKKIQKALKHDLSNIIACVVSHDHGDHSKAIKDVMKAGIDVYASAGTLDACGFLNEHRATITIENDLIRLDTFQVFSFGVNHDAEEPLGFVVRADNEFMLFATDTSHITHRFKFPFKIIAIECSYDKDVLQERVDNGSINESLAKRLLTSHMEKSETKRYLKEFCNLSQCTELHLLHLSSSNIGDVEKVIDEFEEEFLIETMII